MNNAMNTCSNSSKVIICVDSSIGHEISGRVLDPFQQKIFPFRNYWQLTNLLHRTLLLDNEENIAAILQREGIFTYIEQNNFKNQNNNRVKGHLGTFVLSLVMRGEGYLKGNVYWMEHNQSTYFRSYLELSILILDIFSVKD